MAGRDPTSSSQIPEPAAVEPAKRRRTTRKRTARGTEVLSNAPSKSPAKKSKAGNTGMAKAETVVAKRTKKSASDKGLAAKRGPSSKIVGEPPKPARKRKKKAAALEAEVVEASLVRRSDRQDLEVARTRQDPSRPGHALDSQLFSRVSVAWRRPRRSERSLLSDLVGLSLASAGVFALLALLSFSSDDPLAVDGAKVGNWVGPVGAVLARVCTRVFGLGAFLSPLGLFLAAAMCVRTRFHLPRARTVFGAVLLSGGAVTLLEVVLSGAVTLPYPPGGALGAAITNALVPWVNALGTGVLSAGVLMAGVVVTFDVRLLRVLARAERVSKRGVAHLRHLVEVWQEERRMLAEEHERLREELRVEVQSERDERDRSEDERRARVRDEARVRAKERMAVLERRRTDDEKTQRGILDPKAKSRGKKNTAQRKPPTDPRHEPILVRSQPPSMVEPLPQRGSPAAVAPEVLPAIVPPSIAQVTPVAAVRQATPPLPVPSTDVGTPVPAGADVDETTQKNRGAPAPAVAAAAAEAAAEEAALRIVERADGERAVISDDEAIAEAEKTEFKLPPLKLLDYDAPEAKPVDEAAMYAEATKLVQKFKDFGIDGRVREVRPGPVVTTYEFVPAPGIKVSRIAALADDIAMAMEAIHVRIVAPIPGKGAVGIEIPNEGRETVFLKEIIAHEEFRNSGSPLKMALGKDIEGKPYFADLGAMPHVLISGTTGSGKSVSVNGMICSILYRANPDEVKFLMIDPKMLELSIYDGIPHLLLPPIIDSKKAANALQWAVGEMERRYLAMSEMGVRDIAGFNEAIGPVRAGTDPEGRKPPKGADGKPHGKLPYIVIVVDEYADLLAIAGKEVEGYIMRLAQKARAAGIHVMLATQRPSVDVITGVIKANFPVRMGFRLASNHDSKTIINRPGAEKLLGRGDMLIMPAGTSDVTRVHGAFISEKELHRVVSFLKEQGEPNYDMAIIEAPPSEDGDGADGPQEHDAKWDEAIAVVARSRRCSTSWLQRQLGIGYNRSARIVEMMEREGLVGPTLNSKGDRDIYLAKV